MAILRSLFPSFERRVTGATRAISALDYPIDRRVSSKGWMELIQTGAIVTRWQTTLSNLRQRMRGTGLPASRAETPRRALAISTRYRCPLITLAIHTSACDRDGERRLKEIRQGVALLDVIDEQVLDWSASAAERRRQRAKVLERHRDAQAILANAELQFARIADAAHRSAQLTLGSRNWSGADVILATQLAVLDDARNNAVSALASIDAGLLQLRDFIDQAKFELEVQRWESSPDNSDE